MSRVFLVSMLAIDCIYVPLNAERLEPSCDAQLTPNNGTDGSHIQQLISTWVSAGCSNITITLSVGQFVFDVIVVVPPLTSLSIVGAAARKTTLVSPNSGILTANNCSFVGLTSVSITGSQSCALVGTTTSLVATFVDFSNTTHAINVVANSASLTNCTFVQNGKSDGSFGAVTLTSDFATISNCTFAQNIAGVEFATDPPAGVGAGLVLQGIGASSRAVIRSSVFHENNAFAGAGAVCAEGLSLTIESSQFSNNHAGPNVLVWGGAIGFRGPTLAVIASQFFGNTAFCGAPAIAAMASEAFYIYNSLFADNTCNSTCETGTPINGTVVYQAQSLAPAVSDSTFLANTVLGQPCPDLASGDLSPHPVSIPWPSFTTHSERWGWRASENMCKPTALSPGALRWARNITGGFNGPVIGHNDIVYVACASIVYALDGRNGGAVLWQFAQGGSDFAPALGPDGTVFVSGHQFTIALDGMTGSLKWNFSYSDQPITSCLTGFPDSPWTMSSPSVGHDGTVFIQIGQPPQSLPVPGYVVALWGGTGVVRWCSSGMYPASINGVALGTDSSSGQAIVVLSSAALWMSLQVFNYYTGDAIWSYQFNHSLYGSGTPAVVNGVVYVIIQDAQQVPTVVAFVNGPPPTWTSALSINADVAMSSPAVAADGTVFVAAAVKHDDEGSCLKAIRDGNVVWNANWTEADPLASAALSHSSDGVVYVRDLTGAIVATDRNTGNLRWKTVQRVGDIARTSGDIAIGSDGALYVCSSFGISVFQC